MAFFLQAALAALAVGGSRATVIDFSDRGGVADTFTNEVAWANGGLLNTTLAELLPGDKLVFPESKTFYLMGGIKAQGLTNVTISIDGTLEFSDEISEWPRSGEGDRADVLECILLEDVEGLTITSSGEGRLNGNGKTWWGLRSYLVRQENRPRMLAIKRGVNVIVEHLFFKDPPFWTTYFQQMDGFIVRYSRIDARRREDATDHGPFELTAFNTDGFDVTGRNVHMHDLDIWCQDDAIAVKDDSQNMLFERINASGVGLTIGSIGNSIVNNITFRDSTMYNTHKGIYMKFRKTESPGNGDFPGGDEGGRISNILYENITIDNPSQWAIWIGPAQQSDSVRLCAPNGGCSICWPRIESSECLMGAGIYENITLKDITIKGSSSDFGPGVIIGNPTTPMRNIVFDNVVVTNPGSYPWGEGVYKVEGVEGVARGGTSPVPPGFVEIPVVA